MLGAWKPLIDEWLAADRLAPRKQRHTARRVWQRLSEEHGATVSEGTVRRYVAEVRARHDVALVDVFFPQRHPFGEEAEVDFGTVSVYLKTPTSSRPAPTDTGSVPPIPEASARPPESVVEAKSIQLPADRGEGESGATLSAMGTTTQIEAVVFDLFFTLVHPGRYPGGTDREGWLAGLLRVADRAEWDGGLLQHVTGGLAHERPPQCSTALPLARWMISSVSRLTISPDGHLPLHSSLAAARSGPVRDPAP